MRSLNLKFTICDSFIILSACLLRIYDTIAMQKVTEQPQHFPP